MNTNIEVLNENLLAIEFRHIDNKMFENLSLVDFKLSDSICFTNDGKLILNKEHKDFDSFRKLLNIVMKLKNNQLGTDKGFYFFLGIFVPTLDNLTDQAYKKYSNTDLVKQFRKLFNNLSNVEKKRRRLKAEYIKGQKKIFKQKGVK